MYNRTVFLSKMAESKKSQKVKKIKNGIVILYSDDEIIKKHTPESRKLLSIARRSREVQPNEGKSKKSSSFFTQLAFEYRKNTKSEDQDLKEFIRKKFTKEDEESFKQWLRENKYKFESSEEEKKILTEYDAQYSVFYEFSINEVLYDTNSENVTGFKELSDEKLEFEIFTKKLNKEVEYYRKYGMSDEFIFYFKQIENLKFDITQKSDKTMIQAEEMLLNACYMAKNFSDDVKKLLIDIKHKYMFIQKKLDLA